MSSQPTFNISGNHINVNQGDGVNTINVAHNGTIEVTPEKVMKAVSDALPVEVRDQMTEPVLEPLKTMAAMPEEDQKSPDNEERRESLLSRLVPYGPQISKAMVAFGEGSLTALASSNPVVAGVLSVCKAFRAEG